MILILNPTWLNDLDDVAIEAIAVAETGVKLKVKGAGRSFYLENCPDIKFSQKDFKKKYKESPELRAAFEELVQEVLVDFIPRPDMDDDIDYGDLNEEIEDGVEEDDDQLVYDEESGLYKDSAGNFYDDEGNPISEW